MLDPSKRVEYIRDDNFTLILHGYMKRILHKNIDEWSLDYEDIFPESRGL